MWTPASLTTQCLKLCGFTQQTYFCNDRKHTLHTFRYTEQCSERGGVFCLMMPSIGKFIKRLWQTDEQEYGDWRNGPNRGKPNYSEKTLYQCHTVQYKTHIDWSPHYQTAAYEVATSVFVKIQDFRHATPCRLLNSYRRFKKSAVPSSSGSSTLVTSNITLFRMALLHVIPTPRLATFFEIKKSTTNITVLTRCSPDSTSRREMRLCPSCRSTNRSPTCRFAWNKKTVTVIYIITYRDM